MKLMELAQCACVCVCFVGEGKNGAGDKYLLRPVYTPVVYQRSIYTGPSHAHKALKKKDSA